MPSLVSHYLIGKEILKEDLVFAEKIKNNENIFLFGTQGPDFFFTSIFPSKSNNIKLSEIGLYMHSKKIDEFYKSTLEIILNDKKVDKDILFSYMAGFLCHYALDTITHPYIYYMSGFSNENGDLLNKNSINHIKFESQIDSCVSREYLKKDVDIKEILKEIKISKEDIKYLANLYEFSLKNAYNIKIENKDLIKSFSSLDFIYNLISKKSLYGILKLTKNININIEKVVALKDYEVLSDVTNINRNTWIHPCDKSISSNMNFYELIEKTKIKAKEYIKTYYEIIFENRDAQDISYLNDFNFSTGKSYKEKLRYLYKKEGE